jgi:hypothetical protein
MIKEKEVRSKKSEARSKKQEDGSREGGKIV